MLNLKINLLIKKNNKKSNYNNSNKKSKEKENLNILSIVSNINTKIK